MWYGGTVKEIRDMVQWLETAGEAGWIEKAETAEKILVDVQSMSSSKRLPEKGMIRIGPGDPRMQAALPHVHAMTCFVRTMDRPAALDSAQAALEVLQ